MLMYFWFVMSAENSQSKSGQV